MFYAVLIDRIPALSTALSTASVEKSKLEDY
jgi:hypothetical protein